MSRVRKSLTFENVLVTIVAFVVLAGGTAFAANQLAKNSVGKKQLKANAVTTAKIKKNAVSAAKIRGDAVDGTKVADGSVGSANLNLAEWPYSRIVHEARGTALVNVGSDYTVYPIDPAGYTQLAGQNDLYYGEVEVTFGATCESARSARASLVIDSASPTDPLEGQMVASGETGDDGTGAVTKAIKLGPSESAGGRFGPDAPTGHTLALVIRANCKSGSGVTANRGAIDVIGIR